MFHEKSFSLLKAGVSGLCFVIALAACASGGSAETGPSAGGGPAWTRGNQHPGFPEFLYVTALGTGSSRGAAEMDALGWLVGRFDMDIQFASRTRELYWEMAGSGGASAWGEHIDIETNFNRIAGMDGLVGARIGDFHEDNRGNMFALAVLNRRIAIDVYSDMVRANREIITNLTTMSPRQRNSMDGISRYLLAAVVADVNAGYARVLSVLGAPVQGLRSGGDLRREAQEIRRTISIGINIRSGNDSAGRIQNSFARVFSDIGFRVGGVNPRYVLDVDISTTLDRRFSNLFNDWVTWVYKAVHANLRDSVTGAILLSYGINNIREGHLHHFQAENQAFLEAERIIDGDFRNLLSNRL